MSALKWYRINAGNYCTDPTNGHTPGTWVIYRYENPDSGRPDGWVIAQYVDTDYGSDLQFVEWSPTLSGAMAEVDQWIA